MKLKLLGGYKQWKNSLDAIRDVVRGVSRKAFKESFKASEEIAEEAWGLFKQEKWGELEELFNQNNLNGGWPPNNGFIDIDLKPLKKGSFIDRYGCYIHDETGKFTDQGNFFAKDGEAFTNRALPEGAENKFYSRYEVIKDIPGTKKGKAIPWFGEKGEGIQYLFTENTDDLVKAGYLRRISTTAPASKTLYSTGTFKRGSRNFTLVQGDASSGWKHIFDRHIDPNRFPNKTMFDIELSEDEIKDILRQTLKHGKESAFDGLPVFEYRAKIKGTYRKYRATVNANGTARTFHPLE